MRDRHWWVGGVAGTAAAALLAGAFQAGCTCDEVASGSDAAVAPPGRYSRTFTTNADFEGGTLSGVNDDSAPGDLLMNEARSVFETPYLWTPNSLENTITKIETLTGNVVGTYPLQKDGVLCTNPSRTTVNLDNDVWVMCRGSANAAKVSAIDGSVVMIVPLEGVPRGVAIDAQGYIWIGCGDDVLNDLDPVWKLEEATGACVLGDRPDCQGPPLMIPDWPYGAAVDQHGYLWELSNYHWSGGALTKIDTTTDTIVGTYFRTDGGCSQFYGLAIDQLGDVWTGNLGCDDVLKFEGATGNFIGGYFSGGSNTRGVAVDLDGNVWVANSGTNTATKLNGRTGEILRTLNVGLHPIGIGVDAYGHVWVVNKDSSDVYKINGITFESEAIPVGMGPYTYSDMMGTALRTITLRADGAAYWTVNYDTGMDSPFWRTVSWSAEVPSETNLRVHTRCAAIEADLYSAAWGGWLDAPGAIDCQSARWIQVEVEFSSGDLSSTPVLNDLTIEWEE
jgi:hypothetical protein